MMQTRKQKGTAAGAAVGAAAGAALGQAIGRDTASTLWGTAIGAVVGGIAGHEIAHYMDQQEQQLQAAAVQSEALSVSRNQDVLTATFTGDVLFDFDSAVLKPGAYAEIDRVSSVLTQYPQTAVRVEGHTDASGSEAYNQKLSERRSLAVKNALIQRGVHPARIQALGFGEAMPVSSAAALNRRVNIVIIPVEAG
jgi:outer membrane protein OmpA-like peptidoglycan-associated protein